MDTTSNLITSLRNAELARLAVINVPNTKLNRAVLTVLRDSGYIGPFSGEADSRTVEVNMLQPITRHHYKRISKPSRRIYVGAKDIPMVRRGQGIVILSTSDGLLTGKEAHKRSLGGELLCEVY